MRFLLTAACIALLSWATTWVAPWWTVAPVAAAICAAARLRPGRAFGAGFTGVAGLWLLAGWITSNRNEHLLAGRMAVLFHLPHWSLYLLAAALIGGLVGGLGGWSGVVMRQAATGPRTAPQR